LKYYNIVFVLLFVGCKSDLPPYLNTDLSPQERPEDLASRMTVEEKISPMVANRSTKKGMGI